MGYRVLHVLDHSWPVLDGYSQRSRSIVSTQARLGMQPSVLTSALHEMDDPTSSDICLDGLRYSRTHCPTEGIGRAVRNQWPLLRELALVHLLRARLWAITEKEHFDVVHAHSPALCGLSAQSVARLRRIPFVYEIRCFWEDSHFDRKKTAYSLMRYHLGRTLETYVARRADAIVGIATPLLRELEGRGISPSKLFHVPNGVDHKRFVPQPRDEKLAASLGINGLPTLGFLGTLFRWEGVAWLVRAVSELHRRGIKFKLLIVGDGAESADIRRNIRENRAEGFVSFVGRVPDDEVERYYSLMDVLVYPRISIRLTELVTPLKPLEAMALGKVTLGSNVGGIRELIEPNVNGQLFEPGNVDDFCRQASLLLERPELRSVLGEQGRQKIAREKGWSSIVSRYENIYENAIRNARDRD